MRINIVSLGIRAILFDSNKNGDVLPILVCMNSVKFLGCFPKKHFEMMKVIVMIQAL